MMIDEDKKEDDFDYVDEGDWMQNVEVNEEHDKKHDEDISEIWQDCITPLTFDTVTEAFHFVYTMNTQLSKWCSSDKLSKYVYSLNIGYENENGVRDIRKEYIDLLTGIQSVQSITAKMQEQLIMCLLGSYYAQFENSEQKDI